LISHFTVLGDFYQHKEYSSVMTDWRTYPWVSGKDNRLSLDTASTVYSIKTRWTDIAGSGWPDDVVSLNSELKSVDISFTQIRIDQWGNIGSDVGTDPDTIPDEWRIGVSSVTVFDAESEQVFFEIEFNTNETTIDTGIVAASSISLFDAESEQVYFPNYFDSNSDQPDQDNIQVGSVLVFDAESVYQGV
tara:strand:+ start:479 stop:1048 length:570 start_codon:yes stop_codon:yes gene_type:complete